MKFLSKLGRGLLTGARVAKSVTDNPLIRIGLNQIPGVNIGLTIADAVADGIDDAAEDVNNTNEGKLTRAANVALGFLDVSKQIALANKQQLVVDDLALKALVQEQYDLVKIGIDLEKREAELIKKFIEFPKTIKLIPIV